MRKIAGLLAAVFVSGLLDSTADAQVVSQVVYYGAPPTTYVQPMPAVVPTAYVQSTTVRRPLLRPFSPVVTTVQRPVYVAPQPVIVARPVVPVAVVAPGPVVTTRYRPILGRTVTRTWYP